jgi:Zn-dependent protease with chaperone function
MNYLWVSTLVLGVTRVMVSVMSGWLATAVERAWARAVERLSRTAGPGSTIMYRSAGGALVITRGEKAE